MYNTFLDFVTPIFLPIFFCSSLDSVLVRPTTFFTSLTKCHRDFVWNFEIKGEGGYVFWIYCCCFDGQLFLVRCRHLNDKLHVESINNSVSTTSKSLKCTKAWKFRASGNQNKMQILINKFQFLRGIVTG